MTKRKIIDNKLSTFISAILSIYGENPTRSLNYKQVCKIMGIKDLAGKDAVQKLIEELHQQGKLVENRAYRYMLNPKIIAQYGPKTQYVEGTVDMKSTGKAYVILDDDSGEDVFIAPNNTFKALHGDRVKVAMFPKRKDKKPEGKIIEILERKHSDFVGILRITRGYVFVVPDNNNMPVDIFVPKGELNGAKNG